MNNDLKNKLLQAAYNLLSEDQASVLSAVQVMIETVIELETPDKTNDVQSSPMFSNEASYLQTIIDAKNVKISELEKQNASINESYERLISRNRDLEDENSDLNEENNNLQKRLQEAIDIKNDALAKYRRLFNSDVYSNLVPALEANKIRTIKAFRTVIDSYTDFPKETSRMSELRHAKNVIDRMIQYLKD